ncbi:MAG TPA: hypothetical protein VNB24_04950 [Acidimicrobiales bacterium]|nr:hypothetical protein [Acidimicrobiales bacterium]
MTHNRFLRVVGAALMFVVLAAACGSDDPIGEGAIDEGDGGDGAIRVTTTIKPTAAPTTVAPKAAATTVATQPPRTTTPVTQPKPTREIFINDDDKGSYFDPTNTEVFANSIVRFTNKAANEKSYAVSGTYTDKSPAFQTRRLKPGEFEDIRLTRAGMIDFKDDLADYRSGKITVHPR